MAYPEPAAGATDRSPLLRGGGYNDAADATDGDAAGGGHVLHAVAAAAAAAARGSVDAERALEVLLRDDESAAQVLGRPGAVPRLLSAMAAGRAGGGVSAALASRAAEARLAEEAMTADLRAALDVLRGRGVGSRSGVQRVAAGLLSGWAAGSAANRAKLTGLGLQGALAEVATAVSGSCEGGTCAAELQWELLRLMRVMAEHASAADSHHLACCVLPLLYTAADAAAAADAAMASYAVDTLAAAVRNGGAPVAERVDSSTLPHLLWQLAEGMGARKTLATVAAAAKDADTNEQRGNDGKEHAVASAAAEPAAPKAGRWRLLGLGGGSGKSETVAEGAPQASSAAAPQPPRKPKSDAGVLLIKDPTLVASVAAAVAQLAQSGLLPEAHVPRWRDWLLNIMCADGFELGLGQQPLGPSAARGIAAASAVEPSAAARQAGRACASRGDGAAAGSTGDLPAWLAVPAHGSLKGQVGGPAGPSGTGRMEAEARVGDGLRNGVVAALSALSHTPGSHGLQAAHYWLSRLLSELAARTLPYTSLVYAEGPRDPAALVNAVPVGPSYVRSVAEALERAADAVAEDTHPLPPHLAELDLMGSGLVGRPQSPPSKKQKQQREQAQAQAQQKQQAKQQGQGAALQGAEAAGQHAAVDAGGGGGGAGAADQAAAYRTAAHVVDVVLAERKAADALEALCAIVAPDPAKQRWLLARGVLPLMHRLTRTADDPRVALPESGQPGAEVIERAQAEAEAGSSLLASAAVAAIGTGTATTAQTAATPPPVVISELMSDHEGGPSLCLQRQVARMLALLALLPEAHPSLGSAQVRPGSRTGPSAAAAGTVGAAAGGGGCSGGWHTWLRAAAGSSDCRLSSNATRALLHLAAVRVDAAAATAAAAAPATAAATAPVAAPWGVALATGAAATPPPPVFLDGIHLLDPAAPHHWALVEQAAAARLAAEAPALALLPAVSARATAAVPALTEGKVGAGAAVAAEALPAAYAAAGLAVSRVHPSRDAAVGAPITADVAGGVAGPPTATAGVASVALAFSSTAWATLSYLASRPLVLWGRTTALAGGGGVGDPALMPPPPGLVTAASAAEPLQAAPRGVAASPVPAQCAPPSAGSQGSTGPRAHQALARASAAHAAPPNVGSHGTGASSDASGEGGGGGVPGPGSGLLPAHAVPPYPAPYSDEDEGAGAAATAGGAAGPSGGGSGLEPPTVDVVFVHGIRGGPFITWRKAGVMTRGSAASHMERSACWPSAMLAEDFPGARLLSVEYLAPVSAWEGESLPLEDNVSRVMGQLAAAGVGTGQRPVVFVAHSMGGLLVKEMIARSMDAAEQGAPHASLAASVRGIVFYGTPHFGNNMAAMGWKLRHVPGALPAPSLARLTPGPHLLSLNQRLKQLHDRSAGALRVVSLLEGQPTQLSGVIPRILVVAPDSAYPGFGAALPLPDNDHIDCCKPAGRADPVYAVVRDALRHALRAAAPGGG
ncbi:hypothetical protein GPECTOR_2g1054 [Gonium pectorale]|uniref:DUF676 domain-containing protein n=1 Tax=Gonium pectorale TaxID=33097 RepID=A0A150H0A5_GONPE|nr:hypothetical protein GPECTOR_2g1054 [Gonium pectorale]|eukprot:KXZ55505.1 hypothetical protein GPECTOR_2g1054 [Gonium pectorale]